MLSKAVHLRETILVLIGLTLSSCSSSAIPGKEQSTPVIASPSSIPTITPIVAGDETKEPKSDLSGRYGFPAKIDPAQRYLFHLHGKIIEDQGLPAISPVFGEYRYEEILEALENYGFVVISEQRPKDTDPAEYAQRVTKQVNDLLNAEVHPESITVVGASKGAAIAAIVSNLVSHPEVNYVLLGACYPLLIEEWKQQGVSLSGNVLAIYDSSDEYAASCQDLYDYSDGKGLNRQSEIVLHVGTGHGILYEPLVEWVLPTVEWANQE